MGYAKNISATIISILLLAACGGPKIIPDKELAQIFHDIYLTNSYVGQTGLNIDSLNIYEPILAAYGYTVEDVQSTIGNFAKRKSARIADVVEEAAQMLDAESKFYRRRIAIRDTIALIARKKYAETIFSDSLIRVRRIADTGRLRIVIADIRTGDYEVSYNYLVDSLDRNLGLRGDAWFVDSAGQRSASNRKRLAREERSNNTFTLTAAEPQRYLVLDLNGYTAYMTPPHLTVDSVRVTYYLPEEVAVGRMARSWFPVGLDSLFYPYETHIRPPLIDSLGL
jgi:hypothetical protein